MDSGALEALVNCLEEFDPSVKVAWEKPLEKVGAFGNPIADLGLGELGFVTLETSKFFLVHMGC